MKKKFFAIYALAGALVASPIFTSCVDDTVSESVEALRNAKAEALQAETAYKKVQAEALMISTNAEAAYKAADAEYKKADAAYRAAQAKQQELINQKTEATIDSDLEEALLQNQIDLEAKKLELAKAQANAELALEQAKLEAQTALLNAQLANLREQTGYDNYVAMLDKVKQTEANYRTDNIHAIMYGGYYYVKNEWGGWDHTKTYYSWYNSQQYNALTVLNAQLAIENISLIELKNGLVDWNEYLAEVKAENEETILKKEALIKKYTELQATSNRESLEKTYEEALEKSEDLANQILEKNAEVMVAGEAVTTHTNTMLDNPIQQLITAQSDYLTAKEADEYVDTLVVNGETMTKSYSFTQVYEHSAEDAEELATDITDKEAEIAEKEAEIAAVDLGGLERDLAVAKATLAKLQKEYDDVLASEGYKAALKKLEDAVAAAQAAFNANPTDEESEPIFENGQPVYEKDEAGNIKTDENGLPIQAKTKQGTKQDLIDAENALDAFDYNYGTEAEPKYVSELLGKLNTEDTGVDDNNGNRVYGQNDLVEYYQGEVDGALEGLNTALETLNGELETLNEKLEALKEIQAMVAADSEEMKAYLALCEKRAELEEAKFILQAESNEMGKNKSYWDTLAGTLEGYVDEDSTEDEKLPDYAFWIEEAEKDIAEAKKEIERLNLLAEDESGTSNNENKQVKREAAIAEKEAKIAGINDEIVIRTAEYDAEVAALKALIETAE